MNSMLLKLATTQGTSLKVDSGDVSQGVTDATKGVTDATQDAVNEMNQATQYLQEHLSDLIGFGVKVLIAIAVFMIGRVLIQFIRKIVRKSLARSSADNPAGSAPGRPEIDQNGLLRGEHLCFEIFFIFSVDFYDCSKIRS